MTDTARYQLLPDRPGLARVMGSRRRIPFAEIVRGLILDADGHLTLVRAEFGDEIASRVQARLDQMTPAEVRDFLFPGAAGIMTNAAREMGRAAERIAVVKDPYHGRCRAKTRSGAPCYCKPEPGKKRCKFHGGRSTGPKTPEGMARTLTALRAGYQRWRAERSKNPDQTMTEKHQ